jgi:predicted MFS family arabinose efflux permease
MLSVEIKNLSCDGFKRMRSLKPTFNRDSFTWLAYLMSAYFSYLQAALGPLMPFLKADLGMSYTIGGLHFSAFALGMILAGFMSTQMAKTWGRSVSLWTGAGGMMVGALCLTLSRQTPLTIASVLLMGLFGSLLSITIQASLSSRYGVQRTVALTEANIAASISASLVPLCIGGLYQIGLNWRNALFLAGIALLGMAIVYRRVPIPERDIVSREESKADQKLPSVFWIYWIILVLGVSVEYCLFFWGADFLETVRGFTKGHAASSMSWFVAAGFVGRVWCSRVSRTVSSESLLLGAIVLTFFGFPLFWWISSTPLSLLGLILVGVGVANFYPLILSLALGTAELQADRATARLSIGTGVAIFTSPFLLGWLADRFDLQKAYGFVIVMLAVITILALLTTRLRQPQQ